MEIPGKLFAHHFDDEIDHEILIIRTNLETELTFFSVDDKNRAQEL